MKTITVKYGYAERFQCFKGQGDYFIYDYGYGMEDQFEAMSEGWA